MLAKLNLKNFRRFKDYEIDTNYNFIIIHGPNASGKTSILEAIYLLSTAKSPRTNDLSSLISYEDKFSIIEGLVDNKKYKVILSIEGKAAYINEVEYKRISDYIAGVLMVMFSPKDLNLILGGRSERRKFFDLAISMCDRKYIYSLNQYKAILKERNEFLKQFNPQEELFLEVINKKISAIGADIKNRREKFIKLLNSKLMEITGQMNLESMEIVYLPSIDGNYEEVLKQKQRYDLLTKTTNAGIHRDDYGFRINEKNATEFASQGQMRSIIICLKLALKEVIEFCNKKDVILLLDDVFGELDEERQKNLVLYLLKQKQTFITTTSLVEIPQEILKQSFVLQTKKGS